MYHAGFWPAQPPWPVTPPSPGHARSPVVSRSPHRVLYRSPLASPPCDLAVSPPQRHPQQLLAPPMLDARSRQVMQVHGDSYITKAAPTLLPSPNRQSPEKEGSVAASRSAVVKLTLRLGLDYGQTVGGGPDRREQFEADLRADLGNASGLSPGCFRIKAVGVGSVVVGLEVEADPAEKGGDSPDVATAVMSLASQAKDPQSVLRAGRITRSLLALHAQDVRGKKLASLVLPSHAAAPPQLLVDASPSKTKGIVSADLGIADDAEMSDFTPLGGGGGHVARAVRAAPPAQEGEADDDGDAGTELRRTHRRTQRSAAPPAQEGEADDDGDAGTELRRTHRRTQRSAAPPAPRSTREQDASLRRTSPRAAVPQPAPAPVESRKASEMPSPYVRGANGAAADFFVDDLPPDTHRRYEVAAQESLISSLRELQGMRDSKATDDVQDSASEQQVDVFNFLMAKFEPDAEVELHSLQAAENNGKRGTLVSYDSEAGRWLVQMKDADWFRLKPANLRLVQVEADDHVKFEKGLIVEVHSLEKFTDFNGKRGQLLEFDSESGCWLLALAEDGQLTAVKRENLRPIPSHRVPSNLSADLLGPMRMPKRLLPDDERVFCGGCGHQQTTGQFCEACGRALEDDFEPPAQVQAVKAVLPDPVQVKITLDLDFSVAGEEGSTQREAFKRDVTIDLSRASGLPPSNFNIKKLFAGGVILGIDIMPDPWENAPTPASVALDLQRQITDVKSPLRSGKITGHLKELQVVFPPANGVHPAAQRIAGPIAEPIDGITNDQNTPDGRQGQEDVHFCDNFNDQLTDLLRKEDEAIHRLKASVQEPDNLEYWRRTPEISDALLPETKSYVPRTSSINPKPGSPLAFQSERLAAIQASPAVVLEPRVDSCKFTLEDRGVARPGNGVPSPVRDKPAQSVYRIEDREFATREYRAGPRMPAASNTRSLQVSSNLFAARICRLDYPW